jgi:hypothetical protein
MSALGWASRILLVAAGCLLAPACATTPMVCTLAGGTEGLIVNVEVTGGALPPDAYAVVARAAGAELRLDEVLLAAGAATTTEPADIVAEGKHLFLDGAVFADSGRVVVGFREGGGPAMVAIEIWRGSALLGQASYAPSYQPFYPNGESCPPTVHQAHDSLSIAAP